ncbi:GtrA family protein [Desulfobacter sp.]
MFFLRIRLVNYFLIGGVSTLIHFLIASLCIYMIHDSLLISNVTGFLIAYAHSYIMQSKVVFNHEISRIKAVKYFIVQFGALIVSIYVSDLLSEFNNYIKTVVIIIIMPLLTYTVHSFWTFKKNRL